MIYEKACFNYGEEGHITNLCKYVIIYIYMYFQMYYSETKCVKIQPLDI